MYFLLTKLIRAMDYAYTLFLRMMVGHIGKRSVIEFPVKLTRPSKIWIGDRVVIGRYSWLNCSDDDPKAVSLRIGNQVSIGRNCHINAWRSVELDDYALVSNNVHISDVSHTFDRSDVPIAQQEARFLGPVRIGRGAWIGFGAVVLPGVRIGINAVIAALSLVNREVSDFEVVAGIPAVTIVNSPHPERVA